VGSPAGMGVVSLVDTTAGYVTRLEKVTRDQTAKILKVIIIRGPASATATTPQMEAGACAASVLGRADRLIHRKDPSPSPELHPS
jgi:hypothetical protein